MRVFGHADYSQAIVCNTLEPEGGMVAAAPELPELLILTVVVVKVLRLANDMSVMYGHASAPNGPRGESQLINHDCV